MHVNADLSLSAVVTPGAYQWVPSPQAGVERVMLDRVGGEVARATSIVRYAPQSTFPRHQHPGGEEILVLSGTFSDETQDYPAGWYLRNPPGSAHRPSSADGAVIFVKLWQMQPSELTELRVNTNAPANWSQEHGLAICRLYGDKFESVWMQRLLPGQALPAVKAAGVELLVLKGTLLDERQQYDAGSWLRFPEGQSPTLHAGDDGATMYVKAAQTQESVK
jgi:anti-sigma factor ChrR (cupin superfamily)